MGESPFKLAFSTKTVLPRKIVFLTSRIESFDEETSEERLQARLDLISEVRVKANLRALRYKRVMDKLYDQGVCS